MLRNDFDCLSVVETQDGGWTPLLIACDRNDKEMIRSLVNSGANINRQDEVGDLNLLFQMFKRNCIEMIIVNHPSSTEYPHYIQLPWTDALN